MLNHHDTESERRRHRRLVIRLPVECCARTAGHERIWHAVTANISTGGLYFEADLANGNSRLPMDTLIEVTLTVPPGPGYFPYEGHVQSVAEVTRCDLLSPADTGELKRRRIGVAARFREPLKLTF